MAVKRSTPTATHADLVGNGLKTARFTAVVDKCGTPEGVDLWRSPHEDPQFLKALKQNRVLTVIRQHGKKDYGVVGFTEGRTAAYLVFERPLTSFANRRILGINYELVRASAPQGRIVRPELSRAAAPARVPAQDVSPGGNRPAEAPAKKPKLRKFQAVVRLTAVREVMVDVEARNKVEAKHKAMRAAETLPFAAGKVERGIKKITRL